MVDTVNKKCNYLTQNNQTAGLAYKMLISLTVPDVQSGVTLACLRIVVAILKFKIADVVN